MTDTQLQFPARAADPDTSQEAARLPRHNQRMKVLRAYQHGHLLTDGEAGDRAGINGAWKRCSELRKLGLIKPRGTTVLSNPTRRARLCSITQAGLAALHPSNG